MHSSTDEHMYIYMYAYVCTRRQEYTYFQTDMDQHINTCTCMRKLMQKSITHNSPVSAWGHIKKK